jgi:hypothetical protein
MIRNVLRLFTAGPAFLVSSWLLMVFADIATPNVGIKPFGYLTAMIVTVGLWLVQAPAVGAIAGVLGSPRDRRPATSSRSVTT